MILASPLALTALICSAAPVVIYLLLRRRKREVPWGASYLLRLTLQSRRKSSLWKQFVVLAVRALIIALAVILLAGLLQPNPEPANTVPSLPDAPVHRVILLDNSLSMNVADDDITRFTRACRIASDLINSQRVGDRLTILPLVSDGKSVAEISFTGRKLAKGSTGFDSLKTREGSVEFSPGFAAAFSQLAHTPGSAAEIYILSDFPRELKDDIAHLDWVEDALKQSKARLTMVNMASDQQKMQNVIIHSIQVGSDFVMKGIPFAVYVNAVNNSDTEVKADFDIIIDGKVLARQSVTFKPNENRTFPLWLALDQKGNTLLTVQTSQSQLEPYGKRSLSLAVREKVNVWLASEEKNPASGQDMGETEFLLRALNKDAKTDPCIKVEKVPLSKLTKEIPDDVDLIILSVPSFAITATVKTLGTFVRRGGGLILAMNPDMKLDSYNEKYGQFFPAKLICPAQDKVKTDQFSFIRREAASGAPSLFREFASDQGGDLGRVRIYNYMRFKEDKLRGDIVFSLTNDAPLIFEQTIGRGRVYVFASTLGISWNSLPVRQAFIPLWVRLIHAAMAGREPVRNVKAGEKLLLPWPIPGPVALTSPDQKKRDLNASSWGKSAFVQLNAPDQPGVYQLSGKAKDGKEWVAYFTVQAVNREGDLRSLSDEIQGRLSAVLGEPVFTSWTQAVATLGSADASFEMWPWLLLGIIGLYLFEAWFVRKV